MTAEAAPDGVGPAAVPPCSLPARPPRGPDALARRLTRFARFERFAPWTALAPIAPIAIVALWPLALCGQLLSPAVALANRDVPGFHLVLRTCLMRLTSLGWPSWNPWISGGQPLLSNPNYAAFYPPTWLAWPAGPLYAFNLLVLGHLALACAGAWTLARRLGCGHGAAALAAVGYSGSSANLSLLNAFGMFTSMAWFPWMLAGAVAAVRQPERRRWLPAAILAGFALGLQVLNGDPVCELISGLALLLVGLSTLARRPARGARLLVSIACALALSGVQLLPALQRLDESIRARDLAANPAARGWSLPPQRLAEVVFPRLLGDPTRIAEGLYLGSRLDERRQPYVGSLYPGLLLAVLGCGALFLPRLPLRWLWVGGMTAGIFLALGRHNHLYDLLRSVAPLLAAQRFPEKFVLLAVSCLVFAGALGWERLATEPAARCGRAASLPLALAAAIGCAALGAAGLLAAAPAAALDGLRAFGLDAHAAVLPFLRREALRSVLCAGGATVLLLALRRGLLPARTLSAAAVLFVAADLWLYGHGFAAIVPAAEYRALPALARELPAGLPIYADVDDTALARTAQPGLPPAVADLRSQLGRLEPYTPVLWGIPYALSPDYDLSATRWNRLALGALERERRTGQDLALRLEGAWGAATRLVRKSAADWRHDLAADPGASELRAERNPYRLARWRFVPRVTFHASYREALAAARSEGYVLGASEHCRDLDLGEATADASSVAGSAYGAGI